MNEHRLDQNPSSYYPGQFNENAIELLPYLEKGYYKIIDGRYIKTDKEDPEAPGNMIEQEEQGICRIGEGDMEVEIYFPAKNRKVDQKYIEMIKSVLSQVTKMEAAARAVPGRL